MHISSFKVFNFKSYKHFILREKLSPGINIFIGYNGSGKTTLFHALNYIFDLKKKDYLQNLTYSKSKDYYNNHKFLSMIEVCFDNSDRFFPISNDKINIRRIFGFNFDKFLLCDIHILPTHFFHFLNLKKVYFDNLVFKIEQGMHLEFKNSTPKKRLKLFICYIGLNSFNLFEKKSVKYILKINCCKKIILNLIEKIKKKEKIFISKLKLYKKNENLTNEFLSLNSLYFQKQIEFFEKKRIEIRLNNLKQLVISQLISNRIFFVKEEKIHTKTKLKQNYKKSFPFLYDSMKIFNKYPFIFLKHIVIDFLFCFTQLIEHSNSLIRLSNDYFDKIKHGKRKRLKINKSTHTKNMNIASFNKFFSFNQHILYLRKYKIFHIFRLKIFNSDLKEQNLEHFIEKIFGKLKFINFNLCRYENKNYFFLQEILIEKENIKINIFKYENYLENILGFKNLKGIKNFLKILKNPDYLKFKIYGLVIDLILVHKHFYKPIEELLKQYFTHIVVKDKKTIISIIRKYKEKIKIKIDFIALPIKSATDSIKNRIEFSKNMISILSTVFYRFNFSLFFKKLLDNVYFLNSLMQKNLLNKYNCRIVNLDGDIFYPNGYISMGFSFKKKSIFEIVNLLKKNRFFFSWLENSTDNIHNLVNFLLYFKSKIKFFYNFLKAVCKIISLKNLNNIFNLKSVEKFSMLFLNIIEMENIYVNNFQNKKSYNLFSKKLSKKNKIDLFLLEKKIFLSNFYNIHLYKKMISNIRINFELLTFFLRKVLQFSNQFSLNNYNFCKNLNKFIKNYYFHHLYLFFYQSSFKKITKYNFYLKYLILIFLFDTKKRLKSKFKYVDSLNEENKFENKKKLLNLFCKISKKNITIKITQKSKNLFFLKKIFSKAVTKFNQLEMDLFLINQTFDIIARKKQEKIKNSLIKVAKNFSIIFYKNILSGKAAIITKFNMNHSNNTSKLNKNITGITILAKFENTNTVCFLEQMSSGQGSIISFFFFIALRIVNDVTIYIFDEFDANLDFYNTLLFSHIIKEISTFGVQFLLSTFSKNFISNGDKWFGILISIKGSYICNITKNIAIKFNKSNKNYQ